MQIKTPAYTSVPSEQLDASTEHQDANWEFHDDITGETIGVATPQEEPPRNQGTRKSEGASQESSTNTSAGISKRALPHDVKKDCRLHVTAHPNQGTYVSPPT